MTTMEKLQQVPQRFWVNVLLVIGGGILALILVRHAARMNRMVLGTIIAVFICTVCFQWIYERNEPRALTPLINTIAPLLPSKGSFGNY
ncbi:hypothetical protein PXH66_17775 [Synoicihabitans lomoniglobus]|uniref:Uncharacterized protein n=2 Tax=Synoicihabitans lomoniglobus TaxID=2909285 RepID=A0AAF0CPD6_9BACT|nr:hypothetical protein PXH66_17775 [Opitutaceae bacterium LMO-M01]